MKIKESEDKLILQEISTGFWIALVLLGIIAVFLIIFISIVFVSGGRYADNDKSDFVWLIFLAILGAICLIWLVYGNLFNKLVIDRSRKFVTHSKGGLINKKEIIYSFEEIRKFCPVEVIEPDEGHKSLQFGIEFKDGKTIPFTYFPMASIDYQLNLAKRLNDFINQ